MKDIKDNFRLDLSDENYKRYFFPKSFVNKKLIDELIDNIVIFPRKKEKVEKMVKSSSRNRTHGK